MNDNDFNKKSMLELASEIEGDLASITRIMASIKDKLATYADGKNLKGDELVGWLGEIYAKLFLNGMLEIDDTKEHDVIGSEHMRVSVKARKGKSWQDTSAIPKIDGPDSPTHLLFIRLKDDYTPQSIWLFPWDFLKQEDRFTKHKVHGEQRSWRMRIKVKEDANYLVFESKEQ